MCSRFYVDEEMAAEVWKLVREISDTRQPAPRKGDIYPSQRTLVLTGGRGGIKAEEMRWGFLQSRNHGLLINARAETIQEKPSFRDSVRYRRCIIPAKSFYEWDAAKDKVTFHGSRNQALYMAGCYQQFDGEDHFVIITTKANLSVSPVHDRMPLLLDASELNAWFYEEGLLEEMLQKIPAVLAREQEYEQQTLPFETM